MTEKFKKLSRREKIEYIWDYYKLHILGGLLVIFILGGLINTIWLNPPKDTYLSLGFYGSGVYDDSLIALENWLSEDFVPDDLQDRFNTIAYCFYESGDAQMDMVQRQKFSAIVMAKELDVLIAEQNAFKALLADGYFMALDSALGDMVLGAGDLYESADPETGQLRTYGVRLSDEILRSYGAELDDPFFGIVANSQRTEAAVRVLEYLK